MIKKGYSLVVLVLFLGISALAQTAPVKTTNVSSSITITAFTKDFKKYAGYFDFYYDEKTGKVFLELSKFDQDFLYFSSLIDGAGRNAERGQASSQVARFIKVGPKVFLLQPNLSARAGSGNADEIKTVEGSFAKSIIWGFAPVAIEDGKVLIDLTPFIIRDSQNIGAVIAAPTSSMSGASRGAAPAVGTYRIDETRSAIYLPNTKNFPKNTEFEAMVTLTGGAPSGRGNIAPDANAVTVRMHQSFVELPDANFKQRKFDPRSGFFLFSYNDFSAPMTAPLVKRFSVRHRLEKKDPNAAVSEAVKPIIYYIDRGAQPAVKKALIEGGAFWNEAFEAAGFKDAFQVKELPEGADPMDIRYNVVNWIARAGSPRAFSYGSSYIDPRTGEIIKGVVTLGSDRHRQDYMIAEGLLQPYIDGKPISNEMEEMALARIRQLSAHEIGHTLGLNHNFAASGKERASVMDYPFPRIKLKADGNIDLSDAYAKGIGSWDKRAIMWGYSVFPSGADENTELDQIINETIKQGFQYIPDIGGYAHPAANQWEDGADPIASLNNLMKVRRKVLDNFSEKAIVKDAPMATLEEVLVPIYLLHRFEIEAVAKSIGGLYFTHAVKNDGQLPTKMVDPAQQWSAFNALMATVSPEALALPEALIAKIPPRPSGYPSTTELFEGYTGPTFDPIATAESAANETISSILNPQRAARLIEYNARDPKQPGLMAIIDQLLLKTWKSVPIVGYKGELQRMVNNLTLKYLLQLAANTNASENVRGEALLKIMTLKSWMNSMLKTSAAKQKANLLFGLSQIKEFEDSPSKFQPSPAQVMPPGAPIGMIDN